MNRHTSVLAIAMALTAVACGGGRVSTPEDAKRALAGQTFEFKDDTGLPYGIPVDVNRLTFSANGSVCSLSSRSVTRDGFREIHDGEVVLRINRYIDTGETYVELKCGDKGYVYIVTSATTLDIYAFGQNKPFSRATRL